MSDVFNKKGVDFNDILKDFKKTADEAADRLRESYEDVGDAIGDGFDDGYNRSMRKIQASSIKLSGAFKNLSEKLKKDVQQLAASVNGKNLKLKIDFSDVDMNADKVKNKIADILSSFDIRDIVEFDEKGSKQYFDNLIKLYVKYTEKLELLKKSQTGITGPQSLTKNLQEQLVLANNIQHIFEFLNKQTDHPLPIDAQRVNIQNIERLLDTVSGLKEESKGISGDGLNDVVGALTEIKQAINDVRDAFKPLTDAFANEDSAIGKMVRSNIEDLNVLQSKFDEVFKNIETLSNKDFNAVTNTYVADGGGKSNFLAMRDEANELSRQVDLLMNDATKISNMFNKKGVYKNYLWGIGETMNNAVRLTSRKSAFNKSEIETTVGYLRQYKKELIEFNNLLNQSGLGKWTYDYDQPKVEQVTNMQDKAAGNIDTSKVVDGIKDVESQITEITTRIKDSIADIFSFENINPNYENIQSVVDKIYQQFVELQSKINALDLQITMPSMSTGTEVIAAADAIKREGEEADKASVKKNAFTEANKRVAESGSKTAAGVQEATDEIIEEGEAADRAASQIQEAYGKIQKSIGGKAVTVNGTTYEDFQNFATTLASSNNMKIDDVSVVADGNDDVKLATIKMVNEELAQSVTYTYRLRDSEEELAEAYLERYKASSNVNKALKIQLAAQKKADADKAKADKEKAQNNQWLIRQQSQLDTQVRRYQNSSKKIDGSTPLMSGDSSLADDADQTIDSLVQHIRDRIKSTSGEMLTDELREQILNDLRVLKHEIGIEQSNKYSSTNMKASTVETNKKAYKQYLEAFKAKATKDGVFDRMTELIDGQDVNMISQLESMLADVTDADGLNAFIDQLKVTRNKMQAEKAKLANEQQEQKQRMADEEAMWNEHNKSKEESAKREQEINRAYAERAQQEAEEERKLAEQSRKEIEDYYEARDKQLKAYGKTEYNREKKFSGKLDGYLGDIGDGNEGDRLKGLVEQYRATYQTIENLRNQFENDPASAEDTGLKTEFQQAVIHAERLRKEINGVFNESQKIKQAWQSSGIGSAGLLGEFNSADLKGSMIEYVNSLDMGTFTMTEFDESSKKMFGTLDQGSGIIKNITVALDDSQDTMYAWTTATSHASNEWDDFKASMSDGVKRLAGTYLGFHEAIQAVRDGLEYVKEIDLAMTELKKVTDETDETYKEFLETASSISSVIGSTISDFTNATAAFARLGYSIDESTSMAETAILYKNVADGLDSVDEATDSIISTMMAFGVEANNTMSIIDKFNEVGEILPRSCSNMWLR